MSPETKKKLLYGAGAIASIGGLILFMRSRSQAQPIMPAVGSGSTGASGGGSSPESAAAINAITAAQIEQSREQSALDVATLQANTAISIANINAGVAKANAQSNTAKSIFGGAAAPGGAGSSAVKGLFDALQKLLSPDTSNTNTGEIPGLPTSALGNAPVGPGGNLAPGGEIYGPMPLDIYGPEIPSAQSAVPGIYDENSVPLVPVSDFNFDYGQSPGVPQVADYYQGSTGSGDSLYFGDSSGLSFDEGGSPTYV